MRARAAARSWPLRCRCRPAAPVRWTGRVRRFPRRFQSRLRRRAKAEPKCQPRLYGGERRPVQMACDHCAPGADIIDITFAFGIPEVRPKRALDKTGDA